MDSPKTIRVLVVEDDYLVGEEIIRGLKSLGYKVVGKALSGEKAVEMTCSLCPDVILMDIKLSGIDGLTASRKIQESCPTPVVVLSAYESYNLLEKASETGIFAYLTKPPKLAEIERAITIVLARHNDLMKVRRLNAELQREITMREKAEQTLKDTQQQLIQSAKMAAMGQLAAGVSHELNQPLTGIKGFAQAVLRDLQKNNPLRSDLNKIVEQINRMERILRNVRLFVREPDFRMRELDTNQPFEVSLMLLNQQLKVRNIKLNKFLDYSLPKIQGDSNQLQQVFLNFITNARDAIDSLNSPAGGELTVKTSLSEDKKNIEITFQDTGCGIPKEQIEYVFNPFFTTKSPDRGLGLGLSIAYGIIENHKGSIKAESEEGKGTTFMITLPVDTGGKRYEQAESAGC